MSSMVRLPVYFLMLMLLFSHSSPEYLYYLGQALPKCNHLPMKHNELS